MTHKKRLALILILLIIALTSGIFRTAQAVETIEGGTIPADQVINDDVLITSNTIQVDGTVNGNLFVYGNTIAINGQVNGDLVIFAYEATVKGKVDGNIIFAGQTLVLDGEVSDNVYAGGFSIRMEDNAHVGHSLFAGCFNLDTVSGSAIERGLAAGGYQVILSGKVGRDVDISANAFELRGTVVGDVNVWVEKPDIGAFLFTSTFPGMKNLRETVQSGIRVYEGAEVGGKLTYASTVDQSSTIHIPPDKVSFQKKIKIHTQPSLLTRASNWGMAALRDLVTLLVLGGLALWLIPTTLDKEAEQARRVLPAILWGLAGLVGGCSGIFVALIAIIVLGILLGVVSFGGLSFTVFGLGVPGLALIVTSFLLLIFYGSKVIVAYSAGQWIFKRAIPGHSVHKFLALLLGVVLYVLLRSIQFGIGLLFEVIVILIGLGAIWMARRVKRQPKGEIVE